ncbi:TMEM165/GDT1 family protein [Natronincola ferrireducens]|uniref:GDT1 family protein n=1 Tax=Natronincola ferrireducens TaxID=393762 RepID=A0A1G9EIX3_9FIRM|nr:TMEM165/GDT1 family protein [Natronincola ferrireducens]SDK76086.1 Putative Ca2+/H+ antiporter, TMEM165/GDT1 family [Natronincola ferrireducens]
MITELIYACFFIFLAEMGDKTQILAMTFATKYPAKKVLLGVLFGSLANHALAVFIGFYLSKTISLTLIQLIAGCSFIIFGLWGLVEDTEEENKKSTNKYGPILTVATAFFIGELGDKTQLTTIALASQATYPHFILIGTVLGMVLTSGIGIWIGSKIGKNIPEIAIKLASSGVFLLFGIMKLWETIPRHYVTITNTTLFFMTLTGILLYLLKPMVKNRGHKNTRLKETAQELYLNTLKIQESLNFVCSQGDECQACQNQQCSISLVKAMLKEARQKNQYVLPNKIHIQADVQTIDLDRDQLKQSLLVTIETCLHCSKHEERCVGNIARETLERQYFGKSLPFTGDAAAYYKEVETLEQNFFTNKPSLSH